MAHAGVARDEAGDIDGEEAAPPGQAGDGVGGQRHAPITTIG